MSDEGSEEITLEMIREILWNIGVSIKLYEDTSNIYQLAITGIAMIDIFQEQVIEKLGGIQKTIDRIPQAIEEALER